MDKKIIMAYALKNAIEHDGKGVAGSVVAGLFNHGLKKEMIKGVMVEINEVLKEVNGMDIEEQKEEFEKVKSLVGHRFEREGLPELDDVKGKVVMRFAPSASGPFHIGHALTASLSFLYVKKYGGKLYVRIEDTNPENCFKDSYKLIEKDSDWLFDGNAKVIIQSSRMKVYYNYIDKLLRKNAVYVCLCSQKKFKEFVMKKKNCGCREVDGRERWKKMLNGEYKEGEAVLRFKSLMNHKNPAMRDFPLARINESKHPLQGLKYKVWPLMNLAVAVDDIEMKMTHIIRGKDHRDNALRQEMIYKVLEKNYPENYFLGRVHFKDMELSTGGMRKDIEAGKYSGWDDVKLPTLISLRKRGYKPSAFWKFAEQIGLNEVDKVMDKKEFFLLLDGFNRE